MNTMAGVRQPMRNAQPPPPQPFGGEQQQQPQAAFQGTLAPGTRVMIGSIVVTVQKYLSQGAYMDISKLMYRPTH